ncbi:hypothetical protein D9M72_260300 [compost metagenome]
MNLTNCGTLGGLGREVRTELGLAPGALQKHHHLASHAKCQIAPMIFLDQSEREIHSSRYARRCVEIPISHEYCVSVNVCSWIVRGKSVCCIPVRGHLLSAQKTGCCQHKGTAANRPDASHPPTLLPKPRLERFVARHAVHIWTPRNQQRVDRTSMAGNRGIDHQTQPAAALECPFIWGDDLHTVRARISQLPRSLGKDVSRADNIKQLNTWESKDGDTHRGGSVMHAMGAPCRKFGGISRDWQFKPRGLTML